MGLLSDVVVVDDRTRCVRDAIVRIEIRGYRDGVAVAIGAEQLETAFPQAGEIVARQDRLGQRDEGVEGGIARGDTVADGVDDNVLLVRTCTRTEHTCVAGCSVEAIIERGDSRGDHLHVYLVKCQGRVHEVEQVSTLRVHWPLEAEVGGCIVW